MGGGDTRRTVARTWVAASRELEVPSRTRRHTRPIEHNIPSLATLTIRRRITHQAQRLTWHTIPPTQIHPTTTRRHTLSIRQRIVRRLAFQTIRVGWSGARQATAIAGLAFEESEVVVLAGGAVVDGGDAEAVGK